MIKKISFGLLGFFAILFSGITFANPIDVYPHDRKDVPRRCYKLENVKIDDYKAIIEHEDVRHAIEREVYEAKKNECTGCGWGRSNVYLIDKSENIKDITKENIENRAILIGQIYNSDCMPSYDGTETFNGYDMIKTYKLTKDGDSYKIISSATKDLEKIRKFPLIWLFAVIIETVALFLLVKLFQKKDEIKEEMGDARSKISNKKILLWGVIPTTVTLPFLWFVLPLILGDGLRYVIIGELLITIIEAVMIKYGLNISRKKAIITSIACNICSFVVLLIYSLLLDADSYFVSKVIKSSLMFIVFELIILFLVGKLSKEGISNKRLILCGLITPTIEIVVILLLLFIAKLFKWYFDSNLLAIVVAVVMKVSVDMFTIKGLRKISRGKTIIASIFFNLCIVAIILALIYFFD